METQTTCSTKLVIDANKDRETISFYGPPELPEKENNLIVKEWKQVFTEAHQKRHLKVITKIVLAPEYCLVLKRDFKTWLIQKDNEKIIGIFVNIDPKKSQDQAFSDFHQRISDGEEDGNYLVGIPIEQIRSIEFVLV